MKQIEDAFQATVSPIVAGQIAEATPEQKQTIDAMFALWYLRARFRDLERHEIHLEGVVGNLLTKEHEENLEKKGVLFVRAGGNIPARQLNGLQLQMRINGYASQLAKDVPRWGIVSSQSGEFVVPDVPSHLVIPVSPMLALIGCAPDGMITEQNLADLNRAVSAASQNYAFARDISRCPL